MEMTLLLSRVLGLFMIIAGAAILLRRSYFIMVFGQYVEQRLIRMLISLAEVLGGLFLVLQHNRWHTLPAGIISAIGWMLLAEGVFYLLAPDELVARVFRVINRPAWYIAGGLVAISFGAYLAAYGFGMLGSRG